MMMMMMIDGSGERRLEPSTDAPPVSRGVTADDFSVLDT
jgi:hypothetical protein